MCEASENYTGAEIESAIESAMYEAFSDERREFNSYDILLSLKNSIPISKLMKEEIAKLRQWASERARNASNTDDIIVRPIIDEDDL